MIRLTRKKIDFKVYENNPLQFVCFGNCFPTYSSGRDLLFNEMNNELKVLLTDISHNNVGTIMTNYISNRKYKLLSNLFIELIDNYGILYNNTYKCYVPNGSVYKYLADSIYTLYYDKWSKLLDTFNLKYDAIRPYDMTITDNATHKQGGTTKTENNSDSTTTDDTTSKTTDNTTENSIYGFNSDNAVPSDKNINRSTINDKGQTINTSTRSDTVTHGRTLEEDRDIIRKGNIGNITQQELIRQERELQEYIIWETIFNDLDRVLTRSKYI